MATANLEEYLKSGIWNRHWDEYLGTESELDALLETPEYALHPIANEELRKKLCESLGISRGYFHPFARKAASKLTEQGLREGTLTLYEAALVRLVIESLMVPGGASIFTGEDDRKRRAWVDSIRMAGRPERAAVSGGFGCIKDLAPARVLRLAVSKAALAQTSVDVKSAVSQAILGALERLADNEPVSIEAKVRLATLRFWIVSNEGEDCDDRPDALLRDAGLDRERISRLVDSIKNQESVSTLLTSEGASINLAGLNERGDFRSSADFFGFRFDVESFDLLRRLTSELGAVGDPWARLLYRIALASDARSPSVLVELARLGDDRASRARVMRFICGNRCARGQEFEPILSAEFGSAQQGFGQQLFRALLATSFSLQPAEMSGMLSEVGLSEWFALALESYQSSPRGATPPKLPDALFASLRPEQWSQFPSLRPFADALDVGRSLWRDAAHRRLAEEGGRLWLYDLVLRVGTQMSDSFDKGNRILSDVDRVLIRQLRDDHANNVPRWWAAQLSFPSELRLQETWVRVFQGEPAPLAVLVERMSDQLRKSVPQNLQARAEIVLTACADVVLGRGAAPREQALQAFRNGDVGEFLEQLQGIEVELPPARRHPRVFGRRVLVGIGVLCLLPTLLLYRAFLLGTNDPPVTELPPLPLPVQSHVPETCGVLSDGSYVMSVSHDRFDGFFTRNYRFDNDDSRLAIVTEPVAAEFVNRYKKWAEAAYPDGVQKPDETIVAWEAWIVRLPLASEQSQLTRLFKESHGIWLSDNLAGGAKPKRKNPFSRGMIYVIFQIRE